MFNGLRRRINHRNELRLWWQSNPNPTTTTITASSSSSADDAGNDKLSRLPDELLLQILTKLDAETLCRCTVASRRFLPYLAKLHSYATTLPPSILLGKPNSPENTPPFLFNYFCFSIACFAVVVISPVLYFLFVRLHPYGNLALLAAVPTVRRFISRHFRLDQRRLTDFLPVRAVVLLFLLARSVVYHHLVRPPLNVFLCVIFALQSRFLRFVVLIYLPRVSASGRQFFLRLTRLNSLDVTLPSLWFDHPRLWIRGETKLIGKKPYIVFVAGDIVDQPNQNGGQPSNVFSSWKLFKIYNVAWLRFFQLTHLVNMFPVAIEHSKVVRNVISKSSGLNTRARFYFEEVLSKSVESEQSFWDRLGKSEGLVLKFCHVFATITLSLDEGPVHLRDAVLVFLSVDNGTPTPDVVDDDRILACLGDEEEEFEDDIEKKELKEAVKVIVSTPSRLTLDAINASRW